MALVDHGRNRGENDQAERGAKGRMINETGFGQTVKTGPKARPGRGGIQAKGSRIRSLVHDPIQRGGQKTVPKGSGVS